MADVVTAEVRSRMMASIRPKDTKPEIVVRRYLHRHGFRFRLHRKDLAGKPDLTLPKWNAVVFVHGCFWHKHAVCKYFRLPATRHEFWSAKIDGNARRDQRNLEGLLAMGYRVATVWECSLRHREDETLSRLLRFLTSTQTRLEL